jgi:hypothetical protein
MGPFLIQAAFELHINIAQIEKPLLLCHKSLLAEVYCQLTVFYSQGDNQYRQVGLIYKKQIST